MQTRREESGEEWRFYLSSGPSCCEEMTVNDIKEMMCNFIVVHNGHQASTVPWKIQQIADHSDIHVFSLRESTKRMRMRPGPNIEACWPLFSVSHLDCRWPCTL